MNRVAIMTLYDGLDLYDSVSFCQRGQSSYKSNPWCSQGLAALKQGAYVLSVCKEGYVKVHASPDAKLVASYRVSSACSFYIFYSYIYRVN